MVSRSVRLPVPHAAAAAGITRHRRTPTPRDLINDDAPGGFRSPGRRDLLWLARGYYWQFG